MAISSKDDRISMLNFSSGDLLPDPSGTLDQKARITLLNLFEGNTPDSPSSPSFGGDDLTSLNLGRMMRIGI